MIKAYHFVGATLRDGRAIPADGEWLIHTGPCVICSTGLHASYLPSDALEYAPGNTLCLVEVDDIAASQDDKIVCRKRRIIRRIDATHLLRAHARWCALQVAHLWNTPEIVIHYLTTGDENVRDAAESAAWSAAWDAARYAARYAANAAWYAARDAANAARDAARDAANAAWDAANAARDAARDAQAAHFNDSVYSAFGE